MQCSAAVKRVILLLQSCDCSMSLLHYGCRHFQTETIMLLLSTHSFNPCSHGLVVSRGLETEGFSKPRTRELALRRCASKRWIPCRDLDGM